jgi:hypothetical protein
MAYPPDDEEDELDDRELPDESEADESCESEFIQCPNCRKFVSEEAERCHHCGEYISIENAPLRVSLWLVIGMVLALAAVSVWIFR